MNPHNIKISGGVCVTFYFIKKLYTKPHMCVELPPCSYCYFVQVWFPSNSLLTSGSPHFPRSWHLMPRSQWQPKPSPHSSVALLAETKYFWQEYQVDFSCEEPTQPGLQELKEMICPKKPHKLIYSNSKLMEIWKILKVSSHSCTTSYIKNSYTYAL